MIQISCGEGVPLISGRTLDTGLSPYDGLVTPHGMIDFSRVHNQDFLVFLDGFAAIS